MWEKRKWWQLSTKNNWFTERKYTNIHTILNNTFKGFFPLKTLTFVFSTPLEVSSGTVGQTMARHESGISARRQTATSAINRKTTVRSFRCQTSKRHDPSLPHSSCLLEQWSAYTAQLILLRNQSYGKDRGKKTWISLSVLSCSCLNREPTQRILHNYSEYHLSISLLSYVSGYE